MKTRELTLDNRHEYLGASEMAAVCGLSKWDTPVTLFRKKTQQDPYRPVDSRAAQLGQRFEGPILDMALEDLGFVDAKAVEAATQEDLDLLSAHAIDTGRVLQVRNVRMRHGKWRFLAAEADVLLLLPTGERWIIDAKRTGRLADDWQVEGSDELQAPPYYEAQFRTQMAVYNAHRHYAAVLSSGWDQRFALVETRREPSAEMALLADAKAFWQDHVLTGVSPPPSDYSEASLVWEQHRADDLLAPTSDSLALVQKLQQAKAEKKVAEMREKELQLQLAELLGDREAIGELEPGKKKPTVYLSWRTQESNRVDLTMLRERHPRAAEECTVTSRSRVMRIGAAAKKLGGAS